MKLTLNELKILKSALNVKLRTVCLESSEFINIKKSLSKVNEEIEIIDNEIRQKACDESIKASSHGQKLDWIEVTSCQEITEYSKNLEPIWIILEEDEFKDPILAQPDGFDNYHGEDGAVYHFCDISHFMKIKRPVYNAKNNKS